jgi:hypothetical protein
MLGKRSETLVLGYKFRCIFFYGTFSTSPDALPATVPSENPSNPIQFKIQNELCVSFYV